MLTNVYRIKKKKKEIFQIGTMAFFARADKDKERIHYKPFDLWTTKISVVNLVLHKFKTKLSLRELILVLYIGTQPIEHKYDRFPYICWKIYYLCSASCKSVIDFPVFERFMRNLGPTKSKTRTRARDDILLDPLFKKEKTCTQKKKVIKKFRKYCDTKNISIEIRNYCEGLLKTKEVGEKISGTSAAAVISGLAYLIERFILVLGTSQRRIALDFGVSEPTVRNYAHYWFEKLRPLIKDEGLSLIVDIGYASKKAEKKENQILEDTQV